MEDEAIISGEDREGLVAETEEAEITTIETRLPAAVFTAADDRGAEGLIRRN